jgi:drug/metabolite transporter (DMT)-like permease
MNTAFGVASVLVATFFAATGALLIKRGAATFKFEIMALLRNAQLIAGAGLYTLSLVPYLLGLQTLPLTVAYPITSATYVWVTLLSKKYLNEQVDAWQWGGIGLIVIGIFLVGT